jgi:hypothetical protein
MEIALETVLDKVAGVGRKSWISIMFRCTWTLVKWLWCHGMMSKLARTVRSIDASTHSSVDYVAMLVLRPHTPASNRGEGDQFSGFLSLQGVTTFWSIA